MTALFHFAKALQASAHFVHASAHLLCELRIVTFVALGRTLVARLDAVLPGNKIHFPFRSLSRLGTHSFVRLGYRTVKETQQPKSIVQRSRCSIHDSLAAGLLFA